MRPDRFTDKVAFITGGGQGMGQQLALDLANEGAKVAIVDIDQAALDETRKLLDEMGAESLLSICDIASDVQVEAAIKKTHETFGRIDILVNNAGLLRSATIEDTTNELIDKTIDINIKGVLYAIRAVTPIMKAQKYGRIINVASITGKNGDNTTTFVYGASKGAVITITRSVARQLGPFGITCNGIAPHAVMTKMMYYWDEEKKAAMAEKIPVKRLSTAQDMAYLMAFLASDESSFINGETININGGYYMD
ncbi:MAG: glucose 1-dehydrogenase [Sphaerochaetaceae bacterium]|jgi:3-oxoacyl-[acyl-carrier protein] reductase|nr:glucose 1-dehydrogenase [Sphaerochaetaceae bacterium]NLO59513.1 glucose 1-dehydrogenase [Spirochaetales bacterium]MDD2406551.1 glucose 1-dehydrogenase [Sphaerochaetaceae bacterium]MDD3670098.1 glucose 1-dehydrogenase [Sphaerochaetaceae bacterium]MDD4260397.1 glucose 1-dehydrogenase [Sphaerochaetaceae bacterium]